MSSTCYLETNTHTENILNGNGISISNKHKGNLNKNCTKNANTLTMLKLKNPERIIIWQLNINSFRNKFKYITEIILENVNIYLASEAKLDSSFLYGQFCIQIYSKPYRLDRTEKCGGNNTIYKEQIKSKLLKLSTNIEKECLFTEINLRKQKWPLICVFNPQKSLFSAYQDCLGKEIGHLSASYDNIILIGDFNSEPSE